MATQMKPFAAPYQIPYKTVEGTGKGKLAAGTQVKVHEALAKRLIAKGTAKAVDLRVKASAE